MWKILLDLLKQNIIHNIFSLGESKTFLLLNIFQLQMCRQHPFSLTAVDGASRETVACQCINAEQIIFDISIADAIACCVLVCIIRQIRAAGALQAGRPAQSEVLSFDLYNKIRKQTPLSSLIKNALNKTDLTLTACAIILFVFVYIHIHTNTLSLFILINCI